MAAVAAPALRGPCCQRMYDRATIRPGDHVEVETKPGAFVAVGNAGFCS